ncbi:unnamed protein product, partial [Brassica oleracea var. botrytis]
RSVELFQVPDTLILVTLFCKNIIRIRDGLTQLFAKDTALIDKQELDEDLKHKVAFHTDEIQRTPPAQQDEMRAALSYYHETTWK